MRIKAKADTACGVAGAQMVVAGSQMVLSGAQMVLSDALTRPEV
jgi:hypothetical protein